MNDKRTFGTQIFAFGIIQIIQRLRGFIAFLLLTRLIGAQGYGVLAPLWSLAGFAQILILPGLNTALTVLIPGLIPQERRRDFWAVFQATFFVGLLVVAILGFGFSLAEKFILPPMFPRPAYYLGIAIIPLTSLQAVLHAQMRNNHEGQAFAKITAWVSLIDVALLCGGAYWLGLLGILWAALISQALLCVFMAATILQRDGFVPLSGDVIPRLKRYYTYGLTIFFSGLAGWAIGSSDRLILAKLVDAHQLGIYSAVYNLCAQLNQLTSPLFAALMPFVAGAITGGDFRKANEYLEKSLRMLLFVIVPIVFMLILTGRDLLLVTATKEFLEGAPLIPCLILGVGMWQLKGVFSYNIHAHKRSELLIFSTGLGAAINVGLNLLFAPRFGITVAAISTLCAYGAVFLVDMYFSNRLMRIKLPPDFRNKLLLISGATMGVVASSNWFFATSAPLLRLILGLSSGACTYLGLTFALKLFKDDELTSVLKVANSFLPGKR